MSELSDSLKNKTFALFRNVDLGVYQFKYLNNYYLEVKETIKLEIDKFYTIDICINKLGDPDLTFRGIVDSITESKPLKFIVRSGGCFGNSITKLSVSLKQSEYFINYSNEVFSKGKLVKKTTQLKQIGVDEINLIRDFEHELNLIDYANNYTNVITISTSSCSYQLVFGKKTINIIRDTHS